MAGFISLDWRLFMNIKIITGQQDVDIEKYSCKFQGTTIVFPESRNCHSYDLCEDIMKEIQDFYNDNRDLVIVTYSEVVLDAVRLWVARNSFEYAECVNILSDGNIVNVPIDKNGEMEKWIDGVFDIKRIILKELFEIRMSRK